MVEQEHHEVSAVSLRITSLLERALVDQLAALLFQSQVLRNDPSYDGAME